MNKSQNKPSAALRVDRLLANLGYGTRKDIQTQVKAGRIYLDGMPLRDASAKIALTSDLPERLRVGGEKLDPLPGLTLIMHKPLGLTCSHREDGPLVHDLLPPRWRLRKPIISTVGRLDKDTSGLLLMTDDGKLLHRIIAPKNKIAKRYRVTLARPLSGTETATFASGMLMLDGEDKPLLPAVLEKAPHDYHAGTQTEDTGPVVFLTVTEGRYHQVRRMFAAVGNHVTYLHRDKIGGLHLPEELEAGAFRVLDATEVDSIFSPAQQSGT
ncbi:MAG: pseudouridine synthase [Pseudomonadota bacterium]